MSQEKKELAVLVNHLMLAEEAVTPEINASIQESVNRLGAESIESLARETKIISYASHTLSKVFPEEQRWKHIHDQYVTRNELLLDVLDKVFIDVTEAGITSLCVTENFGSVLQGHACLGCFQSSDIDMTADRDEQKKIESVFNKYGFHLKSDTEQVTKYKNKEIIPDQMEHLCQRL